MTSAWDHYDRAERPSKPESAEAQAGAPARPGHFSVAVGDILHLDGAAYRVTGSVALGMPVRELTLHLQPADG